MQLLHYFKRTCPLLSPLLPFLPSLLQLFVLPVLLLVECILSLSSSSLRFYLVSLLYPNCVRAQDCPHFLFCSGTICCSRCSVLVAVSCTFNTFLSNSRYSSDVEIPTLPECPLAINKMREFHVPKDWLLQMTGCFKYKMTTQIEVIYHKFCGIVQLSSRFHLEKLYHVIFKPGQRNNQ